MQYLNSHIGFSSIFTFSYSPQTFLIKITENTNIEFALLPGLNNCYKVFGFDTLGTYPLDGNQRYHYELYLFNMISTQILYITIPNLTLNSVGLKNYTNYSIINSIVSHHLKLMNCLFYILFYYMFLDLYEMFSLLLRFNKNQLFLHHLVFHQIFCYFL